MIQVKICGITNYDDAQAALDYGADAIGFIFSHRSRRFVSSKKVYSIISKLPPFAMTVGVFVNSSREEIESAVKNSGIKMVQLSGDESFSFVNSLSYPKIKAIHIKRNSNAEELKKYKNTRFLLDSSVSYGGSGVQADWEICRKIARKYPIILAGGLTSQNIIEAIEYVQPVAVDVSSGVETVGNRKDIKKMREFISIVKDYKGKV